jgi:Spy/CpxP family protein refolding chaperone
MLVVGTGAGSAQPGGHGFAGGPFARPAYMDKLVLPRMIMRYQAEIGLTDAQREAIGRIMSETQSKLVELQWQMQSESQKLGQLLEPQPVDVAAALRQANRLLDLEKEGRNGQLAMLIKVRNELTAEQYTKLLTLRPAAPRPRQRPKPPGGPPPPPEPPAKGPGGPPDAAPGGSPPVEQD